MSDYIERMKQERKDLGQKIKKLNAFIRDNDDFKKLDDLEQVRIIKQAGFMESYLSVLDLRIQSALFFGTA